MQEYNLQVLLFKRTEKISLDNLIIIIINVLQQKKYKSYSCTYNTIKNVL